MRKQKRVSAIDLFAGAGGLSCGFADAGIEVKAAIEKDLWAAETYKANHPRIKLIDKRIEFLNEQFFLKYKGIDIVAGGPPCQGFSIAASNRRDTNDSRNFLYRHFLRVVQITTPRVVLLENVDGMKNAKLNNGEFIINDILNRLSHLGYKSRLITLNASSFGVPQNRERVFIMACKSEITINALFAFLTQKNASYLGRCKGSSSVSLWDAISDLPVVEPRKVFENIPQDYRKTPANSYQRKLRGTSTHLFNHIPMNHTQRIIDRFKFILKQGLDNTSRDLPAKHKPRVRGNPEMISSKTFEQNHRRLDPSIISPTITASFYSSFIHPYQPRNITVREAARIQSFPDSFIFKGKRTTLSKSLCRKKGFISDLFLDQFNQVGNAIPPLLSKAIGLAIKDFCLK